MILIPISYQPDGINVREILLKISWDTHLKHSKPYIFILQKVKKPTYGFCTRLFFVSTIIIICGGIFLHRLSILLKFKPKLIIFPTTYFARNNAEPGGRIYNQVNPVLRQ